MAEGGGLLNRCTVKSRTGGSNPPLSARCYLCLSEIDPLTRASTLALRQEQEDKVRFLVRDY